MRFVVLLLGNLLTLNVCLAEPEALPIERSISEYDLQRFYQTGLSVHKYLDEMFFGKTQAGSIDWVVQNYQLNLRLGSIAGTTSRNNFLDLSFEKLNESLGKILEINNQFQESALKDTQTDHILNLIKIGFMHDLLVMRNTTLINIEAYNQILKAVHQASLYPLGHSTGTPDPKRSILILDFLIAYSWNFPLDRLEQLTNNILVNQRATKDPKAQLIFKELAQNIALYGATKGSESTGTFSMSDLEYRYRLIHIASHIASTETFQHSKLDEILSVRRRIAYQMGFTREAKTTLLKEFWTNGVWQNLIQIIILCLSLFGVWILVFGSMVSIISRLKSDRIVQLSPNQLCAGKLTSFLKLKVFGFIKTFGSFIKTIAIIPFQKGARERFVIELAILAFSASWLVNDYLSEMQILLSK